MRPLRPLGFTIRLVALSGAALFAGVTGCSLGGLVFDIPSEGTGGGTGSSASSNTGGAAQSSGSTGGLPGKEICTNGSDDDGDGTIDCVDLDCMAEGYGCVDPVPVPVDWIGPVLFFHGDPAGVPSCPAGYANELFRGGYDIAYEDADCNSCSCSSFSLTCIHPMIGVAADAECGAPLMPTPEFAPTTGTQCGAVTMDVGYGFAAKEPTVGVTGCTPQGGGASLSEPHFQQGAIVCGADGVGTCAAADKACAGAKPDVFHGGECIFRVGYSECPEPFGDEHVLGTEGEYDDFRSCTDCACTPPSEFSCDLTYTLYSDAMCTTPVLSFPADGATCTPAAAGVTAASYKAASSPMGSCMASGGQPKGGVWPKAPMTVCCTFPPSP